MNNNTALANVALKCKDDVLFAGKVWCPHYFHNQRARFQYDIINRIKNRPKGVDTIVIECMRGAAKTLLVSSLQSVHESIYNNVHFTVIASNADDMAQRIVGDARNFISSEKFGMMFPNAKIVKNKAMLIEVVDENDNGFGEFQIMSRGRGSQTTGLRYKHNRIDRFIGDDLEHPEEAYSQDIVDAHERYVNEVIRPALTPQTGLIILIGTPFAHDCTTRRFSRKKGVMTLRYPILVDNQIGGIFMGDGNSEVKTDVLMSDMLNLEEGKSIWEDRFPTVWVEEEREKAHINGVSDFGSWLRQFALDPRPPGTIQFDMDAIHYISPNDIKKKLNVFILCDYAYSKQIWADDSAIVAVGVDDEKNFYVLYADKDKWGDLDTTKKLFDVAMRFKENLRLVGVESRSMGFINERMIKAKRENNITFGVTELKPAGRSKSERIKAVTHIVEDGRMYMVRGLHKLETEMRHFRGEEMKRGDDLMDALAYVLDVAYTPQTQQTAEEILKEKNHVAWQAVISDAEELEKKRNQSTWRVYDSHAIDNYF
jgi:hypothetical protein